MLSLTPSKLTLIISSLLFTAFISNHANASWWNDAVSTFESLGSKKVVEKMIDTNLANHDLSTDEISAAFKQALTIGSEKVVERLGKVDGFNTDPSAHISLPKDLEKARKILKKVGLSSYVDELELKLNRAAEAATPVAKKMFIDSISQMSFDDIKTIYEGPTDSATRYFESKMSASLAKEMQPIIDRSLMEVGAINAYDQIIEKYKDIPFVPNIKADLSGHVINEGMAAIFHYIAQEEAAIREDPLRQTSEILKKVFGTN
ncbi:MAG: hypothetical protein ACI9FB_001644 [Candidatus Azotimanducaceae bacterium]|jgi:hypothetical protein